MSRCYKSGYIRDQYGTSYREGTINLYEAGTTTPAKMYAAASGGSAVYHVHTTRQGFYEYWVDRDDYGPNQLFKEVHNSDIMVAQTYDYLAIFYPSANTFGSATSYINPEWYGLSTAGTGAANKTALDAALTALDSGGTIEFTHGATYTVTGQWTINKSCNIHWNGATLNFATDSTNQGVVVTSSYAHLWQPIITGPQHAAHKAGQTGITITGTDNTPAAPTYLTAVTVEGGSISNFGRNGIIGSYLENFDISDVEVYDCFYAGISLASSKDGFISKNNVHDIEGSVGGFAYGISLSANYTDGVTAAPPCTDIVVSNNIVSNVPEWEGLDTHFGKRISFINNKVYDTKIGLMIGGTEDYPCVGNLAQGNTFVSTLGLASGQGISDGGDAADFNVANSYIGNTIIGYYDGFYSLYAEDTKFQKNTVRGATRYGAYLYVDYKNLDLTGNSFTAFEAGTGMGIYLDADGTIEDTGKIAGNYIDATGIDYGIYVNTTTSRAIRQYDNTIIGAGTASILNPGRLSFNALTDNDQQSTSGTGKDIIGGDPVSVPAAAVMTIKASGTKTGSGSGHDHTLKFYYGDSTVTFINAAETATDWQFEATIIQTAAAAQKIHWRAFDGATVTSGYAAWTEDTASAITIKITGECENSGDVITKEIFTIERKYE